MVYIKAMLQGCLTIASKGEGFDGIIQVLSANQVIRATSSVFIDESVSCQ